MISMIQVKIVSRVSNFSSKRDYFVVPAHVAKRKNYAWEDMYVDSYFFGSKRDCEKFILKYKYLYECV